MRTPEEIAHDDGPAGLDNAALANYNARDLIANGFYQVSRKHRMVARLPHGKTGRQALAEASGRSDWAHAMSEASAGDHFLRCHTDRNGLCVTVDRATFEEFRRLGGDTYLAGPRTNAARNK